MQLDEHRLHVIEMAHYDTWHTRAKRVYKGLDIKSFFQVRNKFGAAYPVFASPVQAVPTSGNSLSSFLIPSKTCIAVYDRIAVLAAFPFGIRLCFNPLLKLALTLSLVLYAGQPAVQQLRLCGVWCFSLEVSLRPTHHDESCFLPCVPCEDDHLDLIGVYRTDCRL